MLAWMPPPQTGGLPQPRLCCGRKPRVVGVDRVVAGVRHTDSEIRGNFSDRGIALLEELVEASGVDSRWLVHELDPDRRWVLRNGFCEQADVRGVRLAPSRRANKLLDLKLGKVRDSILLPHPPGAFQRKQHGFKRL